MTRWQILRIRNVWLLGAASLCNDAASEMVMPLLPVFVAVTLGGGASAVGLIEGLAEFLASALKWQVGRWSDKLGQARPFVVVGYGLTAAVRPFLVFASAPGHVLAVRLADRVGKGVRSAPRDALLTGSVPEAVRGTAFGIHRAMDHTGAMIGPMLALVVLYASARDIRMVFAAAVVPGALAAVMAFALARAPALPPNRAHSNAFPREIRPILVVLGLAALGTAADAFLLLEAGLSHDAPLEALPLLWVALHLVRLIASGIGGDWADRFGPRRIVGLAIVLRVLAYGIIGLSTDPVIDGVAVICYGFVSVGEGAERQWIASAAPVSARGTAFGAYHAIVGIVALPASLGFGLLWDVYGSQAAFTASACVGGLACLALLFVSHDRATTRVSP